MLRVALTSIRESRSTCCYCGVGCGVIKIDPLINLHLTTGMIGKPGAGPFSLTGQPNAMGGREVGGIWGELVRGDEAEEAVSGRVREARAA